MTTATTQQIKEQFCSLILDGFNRSLETIGARYQYRALTTQAWRETIPAEIAAKIEDDDIVVRLERLATETDPYAVAAGGPYFFKVEFVVQESVFDQPIYLHNICGKCDDAYMLSGMVPMPLNISID